MQLASIKTVTSVLFCFFFTWFYPQPVYSEGDKQKPVVMVLINEQIWVENRIIYDYYGNLTNVVDLWTSVSQTDTTFISVFLERGLKVVGSGASNLTRQKASKSDVLKAIQGDDHLSTNLGNYLKADFVITGEAVARSPGTPHVPGQKEARANINVRVIKVATGEIIAVGSGNASGAAIEQIGAGVEAIQKAAKPIAEELADKILKAGLE